jgi:hypothetical protein
MPNLISLQPIPRFDISLLRYLDINFTKLRDVLGTTPKMCGGRSNAVFANQAAVNVSIVYTKTFAAQPSCVGVMEDGFAAQCCCEIVATSLTGCTFRCFSPVGTLYTGTMVLAWIATEVM